MNSIEQTVVLVGSYGNAVWLFVVDSVFVRGGLWVGEAFPRLYGEAVFGVGGSA